VTKHTVAELYKGYAGVGGLSVASWRKC